MPKRALQRSSTRSIRTHTDCSLQKPLHHSTTHTHVVITHHCLPGSQNTVPQPFHKSRRFASAFAHRPKEKKKLRENLYRSFSQCGKRYIYTLTATVVILLLCGVILLLFSPNHTAGTTWCLLSTRSMRSMPFTRLSISGPYEIRT